jgi:hypothetical protein
MGSENLDEVALNVLLADGIDAPTAYAASVQESQPARTESAKSNSLYKWLLAIMAAVLGYALWTMF